MASVKVIDLNEATTKDEATPEPIEETANGVLNSNVVGVETTENNPEPAIDTANEIIEETAQQSSADCQEAPAETQVEQPKAKAKPKAKPKASDIVPCPDCNKNMTYKNLRYSHKCSPEPPPVKPQAKPKGKAKPKPKPRPVPVYEEEEEEQHIPQTVIRQQPPPIVNPLTNIQQHYQLLQQQYMKQKQEKYNNLCQNMFKTKLKKR